MDFRLHPQLEKDTLFVADWGVSRLLLMNNALFPWLVLVPRVQGAREIIDLKDADRLHLMEEITAASRLMQSLYAPDKLNVAALGNQVAQLHVHVIARFTKDSAWPQPVWGKGGKAYDSPEAEVAKIRRQAEAAVAV